MIDNKYIYNCHAFNQSVFLIFHFTAAEWISWGLGKGAEKTGEWLKKGSDKLRENIQPDAQPRQVDARTQEGMKYARKATDTAVRVSAFIGECISSY